MAKFLVDENLPTKITIWQSSDFLHVDHIKKSSSDNNLWLLAKEQHMIILTKDIDFSNRIVLSSPPPKVVHFRIGNLRLREQNAFISKVWPDILELLENHKLVNVFIDRIEAF